MGWLLSATRRGRRGYFARRARVGRAFSEAGALTVSFAGKPTSCTLATAGAITGIDPAQWTVALTPMFHGTSRLVCTAGALRLEVIPDGTVLFFR